MSQEDRIAGLLEALELVKDTIRKYEIRALTLQNYKLIAEAEALANGADECRLRILSRIDTIRHGND